MELYLTSSVHAVAQNIANRLTPGAAKKLVFIYTASEPKGEQADLEWQVRDRQALVDAGFQVSDYTITGRTKEQIRDDLHEFELIYISGGDTAYLLRQAQLSGFVDLVRELVEKENKIYIGTSAGSIIAGPRLPDYFDKENGPANRSCFGLVNFTVLPHWGSENFKDKYLGGRMEIVYREGQAPLLLLTDYQYAHVKDGVIQVVDLRK
jgi:dipeptidase E